MRPVELSEYSEIVNGKNSEYLENKTGQIFRKFKIFQTATHKENSEKLENKENSEYSSLVL